MKNGKYKLTNEEKDMLKVMKYNQIESIRLQNDIAIAQKYMEDKNAEHEKFLQAIESQYGIDKKSIPYTDIIVEKSCPKEKSFEELVEEANRVIPYDVGFEDLLTQDEITEAYRHVDEIEAEFSRKTRLKKKDMAFLVIAIALQCTRQYVLDPWLKANRNLAGANDEKARKNNAEPGWYYVDTDKILTNRVPFDAQHYGSNKSIEGFLKGGDHRLTTLGHDPILGWIFGTANIMTSTITRADFMSAHVKCINNENKIHSIADTSRIFSSVLERVGQNMDGKIALGCAIAREAIHLKSDVATKRSLPLPAIGAISPEFGKKLAIYGIDTASVGTEMALSSIINLVIAMVHHLFYDESLDDEKLYEVRTRKVILYSNSIASASNLIATVLTKNYDKLDVGGLLVTICELITDVRFICKVKEEFIENKQSENFDGIKAEIDNLYAERFA